MSNVLWRPQPRQAAFMARPEYECLYGGAAGGGKSDALVAEALRQVHIPHYKGLILRKTYPQLLELINKSRALYPFACPGAKYNDTKHIWTFPSGAQIVFGAMHSTKDMYNYQGFAYDFIGFDELTHFTADEYMYLYSRNRPNGPGTRVYIRATANPGGIGHGWVKERFISAAPPMTPIKSVVDVTMPDGSVQKMERKRIFVPATVFDNEALLRNDPNYLANLAMMQETYKQALLYGSWDSFAGQVFTEWANDTAHYKDRIHTHVIDPFFVPKQWRIYRGFDFGYAKPFSVGWYAVDFDGRLYRIRELYGCTGTPNEGIKWEPLKIAQEIARIEADDPNLKGRKIIGIADPSIYDESRGESVASIMERARVYFEPADNTRIAGKMQIHRRLAFDEAGVPMLYVFRTCKHFIRTIPALVYDETDVEDVDTKQEDHIYDEMRYVCMEHPIAPRPAEKAPETPYNPLGNDVQYEPYNFYRL